MMLRQLLILLLLCINASGQSGPCNYDKAKLVKGVIKDYIDSVRAHPHIGHIKYEVFVARFYYLDTEKKDDLSFTIEYICNSFEWKDVHATHFLEVGDEFVVFRFPDDSYPLRLPELGLKLINPQLVDTLYSEIRIVRKLIPAEARILLTYHPSASTFSLRGCDINTAYYPYSDQIPEGIPSIRDPIPVKIEQMTKEEFLRRHPDK